MGISHFYGYQKLSAEIGFMFKFNNDKNYSYIGSEIGGDEKSFAALKNLVVGRCCCCWMNENCGC
uniref:Uncharacterized protein n=1 Tax=Romanomermis culicivorax TaxID=13658 RepID=A0A915KVW2_ROMCU